MTQATAIELDFQVKRAIEFNAGMMGSMLDAIGHQTLLAPYIDDYRVIVVSPGTAMIEVDLLVRWDVSQTIRLPLTACIEEIEARSYQVFLVVFAAQIRTLAPSGTKCVLRYQPSSSPIRQS